MRGLFHTPSARRVAAAVVAVALGIVGTSWLGFWQLRRADGKTEVQARSQAAADAPATVPGADALRDPSTLVHRRLRLQGRWATDRVVYLDNRPHGGQAGFYVLMAIEPDQPGAPDVMINRGWVPRDGNDRTRIASYSTPPGVVTVSGLALAEEPKLMELGTAPVGLLRGIWQNFDFDGYARASGRDVARVVVRQDGGAADGLVRDWPDRGSAIQGQIDRHRGYAFQWFALAATLAVLSLVQVLRIALHVRQPAR